MAEGRKSEPYEYGERQIDDMSHRELRPGEGRISGAISLLLGGGSFLGVLCFHYPEILTTRELREVYDVDFLRKLLMVSMYAALGFGIFSFLRVRGRRWIGAVGVGFTIAAFLAGGYRVPVGPVEQVGPGLGVDWMLLDLLKSTIIFIFLEKIWPKYPDQPIFRPEWKLDLGYFGVNHLLIGILVDHRQRVSRRAVVRVGRSTTPLQATSSVRPVDALRRCCC